LHHATTIPRRRVPAFVRREVTFATVVNDPMQKFGGARSRR
jgi:hypothetical protein